MKKIARIIVVLNLILCFSTYTFAHGGNITGWKDKNSDKIISSDGKYYGYHNKDGVRHYHQVVWNEESNRWNIVDSNIYYDRNLNVTTFEELSKNNEETEIIEVKYSEAVDGDTAKFETNGEIITVRFLAIDTPESVHPTKEVQAFGIEASDFTKEKLKNAKKIELEFDNNSDKTDKYDRYLAWIWVDGELLQDLLIKEGLAKVAYLYADYKYTSILQESEKIAQEEEKGIWSGEEENNHNEEENKIISNGEVKENDEMEYIEISVIGVVIILVSIIFKYIKRKK